MTFWENILLRKRNILHANEIKYNVFTDRVRINQEASPFLEILPFFHSSLVKISHILKAMIFQFRVDMFLRQNNEKTTSDFIMCVCVYSKYIHLQNKTKTNDFRYQISRLFDLLKCKPYLHFLSCIVCACRYFFKTLQFQLPAVYRKDMKFCLLLYFNFSYPGQVYPAGNVVLDFSVWHCLSCSQFWCVFLILFLRHGYEKYNLLLWHRPIYLGLGWSAVKLKSQPRLGFVAADHPWSQSNTGNRFY